MSKSFAIDFFRIYDRKIANGEITFNKTGIKKEDFTRLCTDGSYVLPMEEIQRLCQTMKLTREEAERLLEWAKE